MNGEKTYAADIESIRQAHARIDPYIHETPVLTSQTLDLLSGKSLFFKSECFQKGGAFKFRGACNAVFSLDDDCVGRGVLTHSSGNHAAALALAAKLRGIPAYIVIPNNAPKCKVENVVRHGGQVIWTEPSMEARELTAKRIQEETGAVLVHPYNDPFIISGQGTISLELLDQVPNIDTIIAPISGKSLGILALFLSSPCKYRFLRWIQGGLISGVALAAKAINPCIQIIAAEPAGADDVAQSKASGQIITLSKVNTIADGLRASLGSLTWPVVRDLVDDVITVEDQEIVEAMGMCYEILKVAVEPSGAIGLAAVLSKKFQASPAFGVSQNIGIVLSGGNVDLGILWQSLHQSCSRT